MLSKVPIQSGKVVSAEGVRVVLMVEVTVVVLLVRVVVLVAVLLSDGSVIVIGLVGLLSGLADDGGAVLLLHREVPLALCRSFTSIICAQTYVRMFLSVLPLSPFCHKTPNPANKQITSTSRSTIRAQTLFFLESLLARSFHPSGPWGACSAKSMLMSSGYALLPLLSL